jgi:hypothetical protein
MKFVLNIILFLYAFFLGFEFNRYSKKIENWVNESEIIKNKDQIPNKIGYTYNNQNKAI